jgi:hypothetical protein
MPMRTTTIRSACGLALLAAIVLAACEQPAADAAAPEPPAGEAALPERTPNDWIFNIPEDDARIAALQLQLRGLDVAMWEVGMRYEGLYEALSRGNGELAVYHWEKTKQTLDNALVRRPARRANAEALFLNTLWPEVRQVLGEGTAEERWAAFERVRGACLACHEAENVVWMNDMAMFDLRAPGQ